MFPSGRRPNAHPETVFKSHQCWTSPSRAGRNNTFDQRPRMDLVVVLCMRTRRQQLTAEGAALDFANGKTGLSRVFLADHHRSYGHRASIDPNHDKDMFRAAVFNLDEVRRPAVKVNALDSSALPLLQSASALSNYVHGDVVGWITVQRPTRGFCPKQYRHGSKSVTKCTNVNVECSEGRRQHFCSALAVSSVLTRPPAAHMRQE